MAHETPLDLVQAALTKHDWDWAVQQTDDKSGSGKVRRRAWRPDNHIRRGGFPLFDMEDGKVVGKHYPGHCLVMPNGWFGASMTSDSWGPSDEDKAATDWEAYDGSAP